MSIPEIKTRPRGWFEGKKTYDQRVFLDEMARQGKQQYSYDLNPDEVYQGYLQRRTVWATPDEIQEIRRGINLQVKERRAQNTARFAEQERNRKARQDETKRKEKERKLSECRALVAEADKVATAGGYKRRRMTKKKRNHKTKRRYR